MMIYTIGFTKRSAGSFFGALKESGAERLVDVRLNNRSQLSGFAKREDLRFFLAELCGMDYLHELMLAPTQELLDEYRKRGQNWQQYETGFSALMAERGIERCIPRELLSNSVLLCSEPTPYRCHRRLVVEYLSDHWNDLAVEHL